MNSHRRTETKNYFNNNRYVVLAKRSTAINTFQSPTLTHQHLQESIDTIRRLHRLFSGRGLLSRQPRGLCNRSWKVLSPWTARSGPTLLREGVLNDTWQRGREHRREWYANRRNRKTRRDRKLRQRRKLWWKRKRRHRRKLVRTLWIAVKQFVVVATVSWSTAAAFPWWRIAWTAPIIRPTSIFRPIIRSSIFRPIIRSSIFRPIIRSSIFRPIIRSSIVRLIIRSSIFRHSARFSRFSSSP